MIDFFYKFRNGGICEQMIVTYPFFFVESWQYGSRHAYFGNKLLNKKEKKHAEQKLVTCEH